MVRLSFRNVRSEEALAGCFFVAVGALALWQVAEFPDAQAYGLGPATTPRLVGGALCVLGLLLVLRGLRAGHIAAPRSALTMRGLVCVLGAVTTFALALRPAGFVLASFVTVLLASGASRRFRWVEALVLAAVATLVCTVVFERLLRVPLPLWPWSL